MSGSLRLLNEEAYEQFLFCRTLQGISDIFQEGLTFRDMGSSRGELLERYPKAAPLAGFQGQSP